MSVMTASRFSRLNAKSQWELNMQYNWNVVQEGSTYSFRHNPDGRTFTYTVIRFIQAFRYKYTASYVVKLVCIFSGTIGSSILRDGPPEFLLLETALSSSSSSSAYSFHSPLALRRRLRSSSSSIAKSFIRPVDSKFFFFLSNIATSSVSRRSACCLSYCSNFSFSGSNANVSSADCPWCLFAGNIQQRGQPSTPSPQIKHRPFFAANGSHLNGLGSFSRIIWAATLSASCLVNTFLA